jgi:hypothetical protein
LRPDRHHSQRYSQKRMRTRTRTWKKTTSDLRRIQKN